MQHCQEACSCRFCHEKLLQGDRAAQHEQKLSTCSSVIKQGLSDSCRLGQLVQQYEEVDSCQLALYKAGQTGQADHTVQHCKDANSCSCEARRRQLYNPTLQCGTVCGISSCGSHCLQSQISQPASAAAVVTSGFVRPCRLITRCSVVRKAAAAVVKADFVRPCKLTTRCSMVMLACATPCVHCRAAAVQYRWLLDNYIGVDEDKPSSLTFMSGVSEVGLGGQEARRGNWKRGQMPSG